MALCAKLRRDLPLFFEGQFSIFLFFVILFATGVFYGALALHSWSARELLRRLHLTSLFKTLLWMDPMSPSLFWDLFFNQLLHLCLYYLSGLTLVGIALLPLSIFLRGFVLGFTVGFLLEDLSYIGFLIASVGIVPQQLIILPTILCCAMSGVVFSFCVAHHFRGGRNVFLAQRFSSCTLVFLLGGASLCIASLVEAYLVPTLLQLIFFFM